MNATRPPYVILGNSAAAIHAVEGIRSVDADGPILLIAREREHTYSRPLITYRLAGTVDEAAMDYRPASFYADAGVEARLGVSAVGVDTAARAVSTSDGQAVGFEKLLIATGGSPVVPELEGRDARGVFTFTTWSDLRALEAYLAGRPTCRRAVVLGGGLIGLKSVEALVARGLPVTVVELADRILAATFDEGASRLAGQALAAAGVTVCTGTTVRRVIAPAGVIDAVELSDGQVLEADVLLLAIGVRPELSFLAGSGLRTGRGLLVDDRMATNVAGVYGAGDVAEAPDAAGVARPLPILPVAARQGRVAGINMAGGSARYGGGVPMNAVDVLGLPTISVGQTVESPGDEVLARLDEQARAYRKIVLRQGRVIGAIFIGAIERAGIFTGLIRSRVDVSALRHLLLDDAFGLLDLPADYRAHRVAGAGIEV